MEKDKILAKKNKDAENIASLSSVESDRQNNCSQNKKKTFAVIIDVLLYVVLFFAMTFAGSLFITKMSKGVPMVFGYGMINIVSGSMVNAGFKVGDSAFIKQNDPSEYNKGDYIAFYDYVDPNCKTPPTVANGVQPSSAPKTSRIVFHEIVDVVIDAYGNKWFKTKGTNNVNVDTNIIYQDYVIGEYVEGGNLFVSFLKFVTSPTGILVLIIIPCSLIMFRNCFELMFLLFTYYDQKKEMKKLAKENQNDTKD